VHAPEEIDIWSADRRAREAGIAAHERLLDACAAAGAEVYVVHPDYSESGVVGRAERRAALQESFDDLHELGRSYPVRIVVENMPGAENSSFVAPDMDLRCLGLALDAGHAQISGTLEAFLETGEIAHVHLHDNLGFGGPDLHLPLGRGCLPRHRLRQVLQRCDGLVVLEHADEADVKVSLGYLERIACAEAVPTSV
jgi:sugar phosphate isomerase/epimerase